MNAELLPSLLVSAGWLSQPVKLPGPGDDLLRVILEQRSCSFHAHGDAMLAWLRQSIAARCHLTYEIAMDTIGLRLIWWPRGVRLGRRVSIVSSRRSHSIQPEWFQSLSDIVGQLNHRRDLLMTSAGTTCCPYLRYLAEVEHFPMIDIVPAEQDDPLRWLTWLPQTTWRNVSSHQTVYVSPRIDPLRKREVAAPQRDQLLVGLANDIYVLRLRRHGNLWRLLLRRVEASAACGQIYLPAYRDLIRDELAVRLLAAGAIRLSHERSSSSQPPSKTCCAKVLNGFATGNRRSCSFDRSFLCHWTRHCDGPWPDQSYEQYLQQRFLDPWHDRSALSSLRRIVSMQRILATKRLNRDSARVVAFTKRSLADFASLRVYRPHLRRWDFEPYGICIDAQWLHRRGTAPVIYGDDCVWQHLSAQQRPFFQPGTANWAAESEWRHVGDVDLSQLAPQEAFVFVPHRDAAAQIALYSRWPVAIV